jgi:transcriptional antiterminator RfaH
MTWMPSWHVLMTKPRKERDVAAALEARDIEVFAPFLDYHGKRGQLLVRPFFPRYIFARFDWATSGFTQVQWTSGLSQVVSFEGEPAEIEDEVIEFLRLRIGDLDGDELMRIKPGERVRVTQGPFRDYEAIFEGRVNGEGRVAILLEILGRQTRVQLDAHLVDRIA